MASSKNRPPTSANAAKAAPPPSPRVRCKLDTVEAVKSEMGRLYREGKGGARSVADVSRLANVLFMMGRMIEGADWEDRIAQLETQKPKQGPSR